MMNRVVLKQDAYICCVDLSFEVSHAKKRINNAKCSVEAADSSQLIQTKAWRCHSIYMHKRASNGACGFIERAGKTGAKPGKRTERAGYACRPPAAHREARNGSGGAETSAQGECLGCGFKEGWGCCVCIGRSRCCFVRDAGKPSQCRFLFPFARRSKDA